MIGSVRNDPRQYVMLAEEWWQPDGALAALHWLAAARGRLVPPASRPGAVLVDLGCGAGLLAPWLRGKGYRHVGVDLVGTSLRLAAAHDLRPVRADVRRVPLADGCADVVVAGELLEHVAMPERVIAEAARLLRPGGLLLGDTISANWIARFVAIHLAERMRGIAPRDIHDPDLFVAPETVRAACARGGLAVELRGLRPSMPDLLGFLATGRGLVRMLPVATMLGLFQFRASRPEGAS